MGSTPLDEWQNQQKPCVCGYFFKATYLGITKIYRGMILPAVAAKVYNTLFLNCILPEIEKIILKNQNGFQRNQSITSLILTIRWIIERVCAKNLKTTLLFIDFSKAFDSIHRGKMQQILLAYGLHKETVTAIMMFYKGTKAMHGLPNSDTNFFDIFAGILPGDK